MNERAPKGRRALGKGLGALIPGAGTAGPRTGNRDYFECPVERIHPQPGQPRQHFNDATLKGLVESIQEQGIIQPLIVRRRSEDDGFELIAGERRWRAAQLAGLKELPVCVKEATPAEAFEMAIVENIQREDLNPIEEAQALRRLIEEYGYTQVEVASRIGRDRSTVANSLRLLGLPDEVQAMVVDGSLTEGHARAILQANATQSMMALARLAAAKGLSVRETERRARSKSDKNQKSPADSTPSESPNVKFLVEKLQRTLGAKVNIKDHKGKGSIEIVYTSYDELDGILNKIFH